MYNNYYQPTQAMYQPPARQQIPGLKGRFVSSFDEAKASAIDFDGSVFYFPDLANNKIYTKQINLDGTASLLIYALQEVTQPTEEEQVYVTKQEFKKAIEELRKIFAATPAPIPETPVTKTEYKF